MLFWVRAPIGVAVVGQRMGRFANHAGFVAEPEQSQGGRVEKGEASLAVDAHYTLAEGSENVLRGEVHHVCRAGFPCRVARINGYRSMLTGQ